MPARGSTLKRSIPIAFVTFLSLTGCILPLRRTVTPTPEAAPTQVATPTAPAARTLTICLGEEPNTLFPYANPNDAALSVLAAIDDGPIDAVSYEFQPVILKKLPGLADRKSTV